MNVGTIMRKIVVTSIWGDR